MLAYRKRLAKGPELRWSEILLNELKDPISGSRRAGIPATQKCATARRPCAPRFDAAMIRAFHRRERRRKRARTFKDRELLCDPHLSSKP